MTVVNLHEQRLLFPPETVGGLIDTLAGAEDRLWPKGRWPTMRLDRPLGVGAVGGHGPIRYVVDDHVPGCRVRFRFTAPAGFDGFHEYTVVPADQGCDLRHVLAMNVSGWARLSWPLVYRPLHDALIKDSLDRGSRAMGIEVAARRWSWWVRALRWVLGRRG